jgi:hypothetical protein
MATEKPLCQTALKWLAERLSRDTGVKEKYALAALTGQDARALQAFIHLVALYGNSDGNGRARALEAMHHAVHAMQPSTRHFAKAVIPAVLDWGDEDRIWQQLDTIAVEAIREALSKVS